MNNSFYSQVLHDSIALILLNPDVSRFENSVDPDQLTSEKPADQDPHCFFQSSCKYMLNVDLMKIGEECSI